MYGVIISDTWPIKWFDWMVDQIKINACISRIEWSTHYKKIRRAIVRFSSLFHSKSEPMKENSYENFRMTKASFVVYFFWSCAVFRLCMKNRMKTIHIKQKSFILFPYEKSFGAYPFGNFRNRPYVQKVRIGCRKLCTHYTKIVQKLFGRKFSLDFLIVCTSV